jgi:undecaprenyl-diphosphatase
MSTTGEIGAATAQTQPPSPPRRVILNAVQALALIVRPPRQVATPAWRRPARIAVGMAMAAVAIALLMMFADVYTVALSKALPPWLKTGFAEITDLGKSGWFLVPIGIALALIALRSSPMLPRMTRMVLLSIAVRLSFLFAAIAIPGLFTSVVKRLVGRARPFVDPSGNPFHFEPFSWHPALASMPSGHATTAVAAAVAIGFLWPRLRVPLWIYALVILASRMLLASHYPSDLLAGTIVGAVGACLVRDWFAARRLVFAIDAEGHVRASPGPSFSRMKKVARSLLAP